MSQLQKHPFCTEGGLILPLWNRRNQWQISHVQEPHVRQIRSGVGKRNDNPVHEQHFHKNGSDPTDLVQWHRFRHSGPVPVNCSYLQVQK